MVVPALPLRTLRAPLLSVALAHAGHSVRGDNPDCLFRKPPSPPWQSKPRVLGGDSPFASAGQVVSPNESRHGGKALGGTDRLSSARCQISIPFHVVPTDVIANLFRDEPRIHTIETKLSEDCIRRSLLWVQICFPSAKLSRYSCVWLDFRSPRSIERPFPAILLTHPAPMSRRLK